MEAALAHPTRAALDDPPRDIVRRIWSAQASVLLPWIETLRHQINTVYGYDVRRQMRHSRIQYEDPHDLELGELAALFGRRGAYRELRKRAQKRQVARNALSHLQPLLPDNVLRTIESNGG